MRKFTNEDIAAYYRITKDHYEKGWNLTESMALHYGYWDSSVKSFGGSLLKLNEKLAEYGDIKKGSKVLDAGCGVGGSSIFLAEKYESEVEGISIESGQVEEARLNAQKRNVHNKTRFSVQDFNHTNFPTNFFDVVWGIESIIHASPKIDFFKEAFRVLKPGGKLIVADYFAKIDFNDDEYDLLMRWLNPWAVSDIITEIKYIEDLHSTGFYNVKSKNINPFIAKSVFKMYFRSFCLKFLTKLYLIYNPNISEYSRNHYKAMYYQSKAFKKGLWEYNFLTAIKPNETL